jgi:hypothetical protein
MVTTQSVVAAAIGCPDAKNAQENTASKLSKNLCNTLHPFVVATHVKFT